jgi:hypothetical protein
MSERRQCQCYKSQKEKNVRCLYVAKRGSLYCGHHQRCHIIFEQEEYIRNQHQSKQDRQLKQDSQLKQDRQLKQRT